MTQDWLFLLSLCVLPFLFYFFWRSRRSLHQEHKELVAKEAVLSDAEIADYCLQLFWAISERIDEPDTNYPIAHILNGFEGVTKVDKIRIAHTLLRTGWFRDVSKNAGSGTENTWAFGMPPTVLQPTTKGWAAVLNYQHNQMSPGDGAMTYNDYREAIVSSIQVGDGSNFVQAQGQFAQVNTGDNLAQSSKTAVDSGNAAVGEILASIVSKMQLEAQELPPQERRQVEELASGIEEALPESGEPPSSTLVARVEIAEKIIGPMGRALAGSLDLIKKFFELFN